MQSLQPSDAEPAPPDEKEEDTNRLTVLLAQYFNLEREAFAQALAILRPHYLTINRSPEDIDAVVSEGIPDVVIAHEVTELMKIRVPVWIHLNVDESPDSVISVHGARSIATGLGVAGILDVLDQAHRLRVFA